MISRQTKLQLLVFGLISLLGLSYTGIRYAGLGRFFLDQGYLVNADFSESGGIFTGAQVTDRGVPAGKVTDMTLIPNGVRVTLLLKPGTKIPKNVKAVVADRSAVGEQYVDLQPLSDGAPYLAGGDVIPRDRNSTPIQPTQLLVNLDKLVNSVDVRDVGVVLQELGTAFQGSETSLQRLVDSGDALTQAATVHLPETKRLIEDSRRVLATQNATAGQFRSFNRDLADLTGQLRASDPDFRRLYANGTASAQQTTDLLESNRSALPVLLSNLVTVAQVQSIRLPAIKQILVTYPNVIAGGYTVVPDDGTTHFGLVTSTNPSPCTAGYQTTKKRDPSDTTLRTPNLNAYCAAKSSSGVDVRGAQNEPRPAGERPYPNNNTSAVPNQPTGTGSASAPSSLRSGSSLGSGSSSSDGVLLGDYNPATGNVITANGQRLTIGSTAGASQLFGASSWQWLLLGPLSQ